MNEYYRAYEERYRAVSEAGGDWWGHRPDDARLRESLEKWVCENSLKGKKVIEYACGEGACGIILSSLGCIYRGVDIAPSAVDRTNYHLAEFPGAHADVLDMVRERAAEAGYDAALCVSGLHMLVTDSDRAAFLNNVFHALKPGGCAYFYQEAYRRDAYEGHVESIDQWQRITGLDFNTPQPRIMGEKQVMLKLLPARPRTEAGYRSEMQDAGFEIVCFRELAESDFIPMSAEIKLRRP